MNGRTVGEVRRPGRLDTPEQALAEGFARHAEAWTRHAGAPDEVAKAVRAAAHALSLATADGHVCLAIDELPCGSGLPADTAAWRDSLQRSGIVASADAPGALPLVLDDDGRLYLHRDFAHERALAQRLVRAAAPAPAPTLDADAVARLRDLLDTLFAGNAAAADTADGAAPDWQKLAAALALRGRLTVISGGPGTGKTTTVVNLLACLIALDPDCRIALAAPTGKAASRMTEAIRERARHLPEALRAKLPAEASTVHRLLGARPAGGGYAHDAARPLPIDALVVDEASMLDLALARRLLDAVPAHARIVLLGDKDQLAAVESGAVFAELSIDPTLSADCRQQVAALVGLDASALVPPAPARPSALQDAVVWFTRNFRFAADSGIGRLAAGIKAGEPAALQAWLQGGGDAEVEWIDDRGAAPSAAAWACMEDGYRAYADALRRWLDRGREPTNHASDDSAGTTSEAATDATTDHTIDHAAGDLSADAVAGIKDVIDAFARFRVLCAVREGPRGVAALNAELTRRFRTGFGARSGAPLGLASDPWFAGRPVLVRRNDALLRLYNGDIGIALPTADGTLAVHFPTPDGGLRRIAPVRLPPHETAFAMTVHKAQGSEFDAVQVMLPDARSRVLTRELLYTGITRARSGVALCGSADALAAAVRSATRRRSGLLARLREAAGRGPG